MRALTAAIAALTLATLTACGEEDRPIASAEEQPANYRLRDAGNALEGAGLSLVTDGAADIAREVTPRPVDSARYAARNGAEFDVLVFADAAQARLARADVAETDPVAGGGAYTTAGNLIAAMPEPPGERAYRVVWQTFRRLARKAGGRQPGDVGVAPAEIASHPDRYRGEELTVTGRVVRLLPVGAEQPLAFTIRGDRRRELLVVPERGVDIPPALVDAPDTDPPPRVRVTGEATRMRDGGPPNVPHEEDTLAYRGGDPVLVAADLRTIP